MPTWKPMDQAPKDRPIAIAAISFPLEQVEGPTVVPEFRDVLDAGVVISIDVCQWRDHGFVIGWGWDTRVGHANMHAWCDVHELGLRELLPAGALGRVA